MAVEQVVREAYKYIAEKNPEDGTWKPFVPIEDPTPVYTGISDVARAFLRFIWHVKT